MKNRAKDIKEVFEFKNTGGYRWEQEFQMTVLCKWDSSGIRGANVFRAARALPAGRLLLADIDDLYKNVIAKIEKDYEAKT